MPGDALSDGSVIVASTSTPNLTDEHLANGRRYFYAIYSVNATLAYSATPALGAGAPASATLNLWTFTRGATVNANVAPKNAVHPGGRRAGQQWIKPYPFLAQNYNVLIAYGGQGFSTNEAFGYLGDFWTFDSRSGQWSLWDFLNPGYLTDLHLGTNTPANATNNPGGREHAATWVGADGSLWMYGGTGVDTAGNVGPLDDLWTCICDPNTFSSWTWRRVTGTGVAGTLPTNTGGSSDSPGARYGATAAVDASGNLWLYGGFGFAAPGGGANGALSDLWSYDVTNNLWHLQAGSTALNVPVTSSCTGTPSACQPGGRGDASMWIDALGILRLSGGATSSPENGSRGQAFADLWSYDPTSQVWTVIGGTPGLDQPGVYDPMPNPASPSAGHYPGARGSALSWLMQDGGGNQQMYLYGGSGIDGTGTSGVLGDVWRAATATQMWEWLGISGSNVANQAPSVAATATPGARADLRVAKSAAGSALTQDIAFFGGTQTGADGAGAGLFTDTWTFNSTTAAWQQLNASPAVRQGGIYGATGTAAAANAPGMRSGAATWVDGDNNLWLFGGLAFDAGAARGPMNDLWRFDGSYWTWVNGAQVTGASGVYGNHDFAPANVPGARSGAAVASPGDGTMFLFGGTGVDADGTSGALADLWQWNGAEWRHLSGPSTAGARPTAGAAGAASTSYTPGGRFGAAMWLDAAGELWLFGGQGVDANGATGTLNDLWRFDAATGWAYVAGPLVSGGGGQYTAGASSTNWPAARSDAVAWSDGKGSLWLFGGYHGYDPVAQTDTYLNDFLLWDGTKWTWLGGNAASVTNAVGVYGIQGQGAAGNIPGARHRAISWRDARGVLWLLGGFGQGAPNGITEVTPLGYLNDLWSVDPATPTTWTWMAGSRPSSANTVITTPGVATAGDVPGARAYGAGWADQLGRFWLLGGYGFGTSQSLVDGSLGDLWRYDPN